MKIIAELSRSHAAWVLLKGHCGPEMTTPRDDLLAARPSALKTPDFEGEDATRLLAALTACGGACPAVPALLDPSTRVYAALVTQSEYVAARSINEPWPTVQALGEDPPNRKQQDIYDAIPKAAPASTAVSTWIWDGEEHDINDVHKCMWIVQANHFVVVDGVNRATFDGALHP